jgi:hypothetical protein
MTPSTKQPTMTIGNVQPADQSRLSISIAVV